MTSSVPTVNHKNDSDSKSDEENVVAANPQQKTHFPNISFSRDALLKIKESKNSKQELEENMIFTNSKVLFKILRPECKLLERQSKSHDSNSIILGPQKRSWNIGCHVSQAKRSSQDSFPKSQKCFQEKFSRGDFRRDSKLAERNSVRSNTAANSGFARSAVYGKESIMSKVQYESVKDTDNEPEWFTDGPETINDTVELGMVLEDGDFKADKPSRDHGLDSSSLSPDLDSAILSLDKEKLPFHLPSISCNVKEADFLTLLDHPKGKEPCRFQLFANSDPSISFANTNSDDNNSEKSSRLLKLIANSNNSATTRNQATYSQAIQPSTAELESVLKALFIGTKPTPTCKTLEVPRTSSYPTLLTSVPTVEEVEAAAFYRDGEIAPKPAIPQSSTFQDQISPPWGIEKQPQPPLSTFCDSVHSTPQSHGLLEALQQRDASLTPLEKIRTHRFESQSDRNMANWNGQLFSNLSDPSGDIRVDPPSSSRGHNYFNSPINVSSRLLPNDPAIAFQYTNRRPVFKNFTAMDPLMAQNQPKQYPSQQSYSLTSLRHGMPNSTFGSGTAAEAALSQLKDPGASQQNFAAPSNSLFSNAIIGSENNRHIEQLRLHKSGTVSRNVVSNCPYSQSQLKQNGSVPSLLPSVWETATKLPSSAVDLLLLDIAGQSGIGGLLPSPGLELPSPNRKAS